MNDDTLTDVSDSKQVAKAIKASKTKDEVRAEGLRQLMSSQQGRAWMWGFLEWCDPYRTPYNPDPIKMSFNCGQANAGLKLIAETNALDSELYLVMMKENSNG